MICNMSWNHTTGLFLQDHKTPLQLAVEYVLQSAEEYDVDINIDVVKMLLEKGADCNVKDKVSYIVS